MNIKVVWRVILVVLLLCIFVWIFPSEATTSPTTAELAQLRDAYERGDVVVQIRRYDRIGRDEFDDITWGNPTGGIFKESDIGDDWRQGVFVEFIIVRHDRLANRNPSVATITIPAEKVPRNPAIEEVWSVAESGTYYFKNFENLP